MTRFKRKENGADRGASGLTVHGRVGGFVQGWFLVVRHNDFEDRASFGGFGVDIPAGLNLVDLTFGHTSRFLEQVDHKRCIRVRKHTEYPAAREFNE